jgi:hypothetical protein
MHGIKDLFLLVQYHLYAGASRGGSGHANDTPFGKNLWNWQWKSTSTTEKIFEIYTENLGFWENDPLFKIWYMSV